LPEIELDRVICDRDSFHIQFISLGKIAKAGIKYRLNIELWRKQR